MTPFIKYEDCAARFSGKSVAIVGSGPSCLENKGSFIDGHDIVVRVNNYKIKTFETAVGTRTDVFYSFFGSSIRKTAEELQEDGVTLCMCKCPDVKFIESEWHRKRGKEKGTDFRYIYTKRAGWWFCDTYAPTHDRFMEFFNILQKHVPTTGFQCILEILSFDCKSIYITGFDFFTSRRHNVTDRWFPKNPDDPIGHRPDLEKQYMRRLKDPRVTYDKTLQRILK